METVKQLQDFGMRTCHLFAKKSKKPSKHPRRGGPSTDLAGGPLGSPTELDISPEDAKRKRRFCAFSRGSKGGDRQLLASNTSTSAAKTFASLSAALEIISAAYANRREFGIVNVVEILTSRIAALKAHFAALTDDVADERGRTDTLEKLKDIEGRLRLLCKNLTPLRFVGHARETGSVSRLLNDLQEVTVGYQMAVQTTIYHQGCKLIDPAEQSILNNICRAHGAGFLHGGRRGCLKGTREAILGEIELWTKNFDKSSIFWLNGLAGTGKSTIAQTIAERTFAGGQLGASFFCSRDFEDRSNLQSIFPTLGFQLAQAYPEFRSEFVRVVQLDPQVTRESLYNQVDKLIVQPLKLSDISTVIIIDALDECRDEQSASAILSVLGQFVAEIPKVKFLITGRPEPRIQSGFRLPLMAKATDVFVLHNVEPSLVSNDIRLFLKHNLSELADRQGGPHEWLTEGDLDTLCQRAGGLFVHAVATAKFMDHEGSTAQGRLNLLLESPESSAHEGATKLRVDTTLDSLYMSILQEAFKGSDVAGDCKIRSVLGVVVLAANPLSPSAIATLLGLHIDVVLHLLSSIQSLLILHDDPKHPVRPFHKSFPDFITSSNRCLSERFYVSTPDHQTGLLTSCIELMNQRLEKNMCKLPEAVANSEVDDLQARVERYIDNALQYACKSWHKHLVGARRTSLHVSTIISALRRFLGEKFLFWLETLSVLGVAREAVHALNMTKKWVKEVDLPQTVELVDDCFRFVTGFFDVINGSSTHISHSALALAPHTSIVRKLYEQDSHHFTRVVRGVPNSWDSSIASTKCPSGIGAVTWSHCGRLIAITWADSTIEVLDPVTLERLYTMHSPPGTRVLAFSLDSRLLLCCGFFTDAVTNYIASWDIQTGSIVGVRESEAQLDGRSSVVIPSEDGRMVGVLYLMPTSPGKFTICIYNLSSGECMCSHLFEGSFARIWLHGNLLGVAAVLPTRGTMVVQEVSFSSGHLQKGEVYKVPNTFNPSQPFLLLPTIHGLAFIIGNFATIWDLLAGKPILWANNANFKGSTMSATPDGRFFACGTTGTDVYLWKRSEDHYKLHQKLTSSVPSPIPLFSPDKHSVITWNNSTIQLWPLECSATPIPTDSPQTPASSERFILELSPDRDSAAVTRLRGNVVTVLDLNSGAPQLVIDAGMEVYGLKVYNNTVTVEGAQEFFTQDLPMPMRDRTFNTRTNTTGGRTRTALMLGRTSGPQSTSISPDLSKFSCVATSSEVMPVGTLDIYDVKTGGRVGNTTASFDMPWFSPNGEQIWCGEVDRMEGWKIVKSDDPPLINLVRLAGNPPEEWPWRSSRGYSVTSDGWILDREGKRLLWLPPHWRSNGRGAKVWCGPFLALLHNTLPEPVIIKLEV